MASSGSPFGGGPITTRTQSATSAPASPTAAKPFAVALATTTLLACGPSQACWDEAAARYGLSRELLHAIARTESGLNPLAVGHNADGSRDIGLMQINSWWLPHLLAHGISERHLWDPCTSIHVGAWILAGNVSRLGYTWDAVGAYNARSPAKRAAYAVKVHRQVLAISAEAARTASPRPSRPTPFLPRQAAALPPGVTQGDHAH